MKKKWELLKFAYDNYPKGTKFYNMVTKSVIESSGLFEISEAGSIIHSVANDNGGKTVLYKTNGENSGKWAEMVSEQPATKQGFIISEEGETLYDGDKYFHVTKVDGVWKINKSFEPDYALLLTRSSLVNHAPDNNKAFKNYSSAASFIKNQIVVVSPDSTYPIHVSSSYIVIQSAKHEPGENLVMSVDEVEECLRVYKLLNEKD